MRNLDKKKLKVNLLKALLIIGMIVIIIIVGFYVTLYLWAKEINQSFINKKNQPQKYDYQLEKYKNYYNKKEQIHSKGE